jgi:signal transduction histidine kinase
MSLERQLQIGFTLSLVLLLGLLWWSAALAVRQLTEQFVLSRLEHDAEQVLAIQTRGRRDRQGLGLHSARIPPVYQKAFSGHYYALRLPDGSIERSRSLWDRELEIPDLAPGDQRVSRAPGPERQSLLVLAQGFEQASGRLVVVVAEDLTPLEDQIGRFQWLLAGLMLVTALLLLAVQRLILRKGFQRLEPVRTDIRRLADGEIDSLREDVPTEVRPLVRELNRVLALLAQRLERSRHALGNLAHALKAPLSLLTQQLEDRQTPVDPGEVRTQAERIRSLIERELRRARLAGLGQVGRLFHPAEDVPDLIQAIRHVHMDRDLAIRFDDHSSGPLHLDREDLLELLGNLLDNACKWGQRHVTLRIEDGAASTRIDVEDDGPGVSDTLIDQLTRRGVRADETTEGHGLGLAIAKDMIRLYGGQIAFSRCESLGGLRVQVELPKAPPPEGTP